MAATLRCPSCGSPDVGPPAADGERRCAHCGVRFQPGAAPVPPAGPDTTHDTRATPLLGLLAGIAGLLGVGVAVFVASSSDDVGTTTSLPGPMEQVRPVSVPETAATTSAAPEARPDPSAELVVHGTHSGYQESFYVLTEVTSTSPYVLDKPKLLVVLLDEDGGEVGQAVGYADLPVLAPGQTTPASVLVKDPPPHADFRVELSLSEATYVPDLADGLRVETLPAQEDRSGWFSVGGKVHNDGETPAHFVEVHAVARAEDGRIVGIDQTYATGKEALAPGAFARFQLSNMTYDERPASWDFLVTGRVAD